MRSRASFPGHNAAMDTLTHEIAATAARLVVEEGLDYGSAKRRAQKMLGLPARTALPDNEQLEEQVRAYIGLFHAETQPQELAALRRLALSWMERLAEFRPHLCGAVWNGTATRRSDIHLDLFCDDPKSPEITLLNLGLRYDTRTHRSWRGSTVDVLSFSAASPELGEAIGIHLMIHDHDDLRGALKSGAGGQAPRGDRQALLQRQQLEASA